MTARSFGLLFLALAWGLIPAEALPQDSAVKASLSEAEALNRMAEPEAALEMLAGAERAAKDRGDTLGAARLQAARGRILSNAGARGRAEALLEDSSRILLASDSRRWRAEGFSARALLEQLRGQPSAARRSFLQSAAEFRSSGDEIRAAIVEANHSAAAATAGRWAEAIDLGRRALAVLETAGRPEALRALIGIGYALHQQHRSPEALEVYETLIERAGALGDQQTLQFAYCNRAELRGQAGDIATAEEDLRRVLRGLEEDRPGRMVLPRESADHLESQVEAYDRLILLLADSYRGLEGFEVAERFHARAFVEMLRRQEVLDLQRRNPELLEQRRALLNELGAARLELERKGEQGAAAPRRRIQRLASKLTQLEVEVQRLQGDRQQSLPPVPLKLEEVRGRLRPGEALVSYWVSEERVLVWTFSPGAARLTQIPLPRQELRETLERYLDTLRSSRRAEDAALRDMEEAHLADGRRLYDWLIAPLPSFVRKAQRIFLVADDVLNYLPFEALVIECAAASARTENPQAIHGQYRSCRFLGLEKEWIYNPSVGALRALQERGRGRPGSKRRTLLTMAPDLSAGPVDAPAGSSGDVPAELRSHLSRLGPLIEAPREARAIGALFADPRVILGRAASESRFKAEAPSYHWIHLATHGLVRDDLPMTSGLLLAEDQHEDGLLQAYEVLDLRLQAAMVTLSACRTGRGELRKGEGILGLSQAFLQAGAGSVLVSLWDVEDRSTAHFMASLYRHIRQGNSPPRALLEARRELFRRDGEARLVFRTRPLAYAHPRFWAPFILIGAP